MCVKGGEECNGHFGHTFVPMYVIAPQSQIQRKEVDLPQCNRDLADRTLLSCSWLQACTKACVHYRNDRSIYVVLPSNGVIPMTKYMDHKARRLLQAWILAEAQSGHNPRYGVANE